MGFHGRLTILGMIWIACCIGISYLYITNSHIHYKVIIVVLLIYTLFGWWLGYRYDHLKDQSLRDVLTHTYNRRYVYNMFPKLRIQAARHNQKLTVFVIDVNDFKQVNDTSGHALGDLVLKNIAKSLNQIKKEGDVIARWGGDEFLMITASEDAGIPRLTPLIIETGLSELSKRINAQVTVSIGKAIYPDDAKSLDKLLKIADQNMYELKQNYKHFTE